MSRACPSTKTQTPHGFTLIELLVAVSIIGLLMSVATVSYNTVNQRSRNAKRVSDLEQLRNALEMYKSDHPNNSYPYGFAEINREFPYGLAHSLVPTYISRLPENPGRNYFYMATGHTWPFFYSYRLCTTMEGSSHPIGTCDPNLCGHGIYNYCVQQP